MSNEAIGLESEAPDIRHGENHRGAQIFTGFLRRVREGHGWAFSDEPPEPPDPVRRPARVARMLAFGHRFQAAIDDGEYRDRAELARRLGITRARVTQLLDLTLLAPVVQEEILFLEAVDSREPISERALREVVRYVVWSEQRAKWGELTLPSSGCGEASCQSTLTAKNLGHDSGSFLSDPPGD